MKDVERKTQAELLLKWIPFVAKCRQQSPSQIVSQLKLWLPQWQGVFCEAQTEKTLDLENDLISKGLIKKEILKADSCIESGARQKSGSYYTPQKWANYMVRRIMEVWISQFLKIDTSRNLWPLSKGYLKEPTEEMADSLLDEIFHLKIVDIACGTGVFLMEMLQTLENIVSWLLPFSSEKTIHESWKKKLALEVVSGRDLNPEALALYGLWIIYRYGPFSENEKSPVFCLDSLSNENGKERETYDIVIGNPPYLGEKGNRDLFLDLKEKDIGKKHYEGKMDLSYFFVVRGLELLKYGGFLTYLTTNYFITADGAKGFRSHIKEQADFVEFLNLNALCIFPEATGQHSAIYTLEKKKWELPLFKSFGSDVAHKETSVIHSNNHKKGQKDQINIENLLQKKPCSNFYRYTCHPDELYRPTGKIVLYSQPQHKEILKIYEDVCDTTWGNCFEIHQGLVSGADQVTGSMLKEKLSKEDIKTYGIEKGMPIFVFPQDFRDNYFIEEEWLKPFYKNSDVDAYCIKRENTYWVAYVDGSCHEEIFEKAPHLMSHLSLFKSVLEKRREVKAGSRKWYALQWPRRREVFTGPKIVVPQRHKRNQFAYTDKPFYGSADLYYFKAPLADANLFSKNKWMYHLALSNSSILYMWLYHFGKKKGNALELYAQSLKQVAVPAYKEKLWQKELANIMKTGLESENHLTFSEEMKMRKALDFVLHRAFGFDRQQQKIISDFAFRTL